VTHRNLAIRFKSAFSKDSQNNLRSFRDVLWNTDSDYFILMARKAACLFDCLRELKIADVRGRALNDRVLDMDLDWLRGKKVTLVDDCIFSGTTLFRAAELVQRAGCSQFDTIAMAVNSDTLRPQLLPGGEEWGDIRIADPVLRANDAACVRQCFDVVRAISILPRPYDVDFPHTYAIKMKNSEFDAVLGSGSWRSFDVTSDFQRANDVVAFSIIPTESELDRFVAWHGGYSKSVSCAKVRLYARRLRSGSYSVRLVPMIVLSPIENDEVISTLNSGSRSRSDRLDSMGFRSTSSRYRLLNYVISHCLLKWFVDGHVRGPQRNRFLTIRSDLMEMSFGVGAWSNYEKMWPDLESVRIPKSTTIELGATVKRAPNHVARVHNPIEFFKEMSNPFEWLYSEKEIGVRDWVYRNGLRSNVPNTKRLIEGLTFERVSGRIESGSVEMPVAASVALDRLIDLGVAIPNIFMSERSCARTFRHGEDAIIGPAQERMILVGLQAYMDKVGASGLSGIELQKVIVLLIQAAIRNGDIEGYALDAEFPPGAYVVGVKGFLHGNVPTAMSEAEARVDNPPFISGSKSRPQWLVDRWVLDKYLERDGRSTISAMTRVAKLPDLSAGRKAESKLRLYAKGLGAAMRAGLLGDDKELVLLSCCAEPDHQLRALTGELVYFRDCWPELLPKIQSLVAKEQYKDARSLLRSGRVESKFYAAFGAVNSGARKYDYYVDGYFRRRVDEIYGSLVDLEKSPDGVWEDAADCWATLWPESDPIHSSTGTPAGELIHRSGRWLHSLNVALRVFDVGLVYRGFQVGQFSKADLGGCLADLRERITAALDLFDAAGKMPRYCETMSNIVSSLDSDDLSSVYAWEQDSERIVDTWIHSSNSMLEDAQCICSAYGDITGIYHFPYAIIVETRSKDDREKGIAHNIVYTSLKRLERTSYILLEGERNPWPASICVVLSGGRADRTAAKLGEGLARELQSKKVNHRVVVVGGLAYTDSVRRFIGSASIALESFRRRMIQIREAIPNIELSDELCFVTFHGTDEFELESRKVGKASVRLSMTACGESRIESSLDAQRIITVESATYTHATGRMRLLLCTATDTEDDVLEGAIHRLGYGLSAKKGEKGVYTGIGEIGSSDVYWVRSGMGSGGENGSALTVLDAIDDINPVHVISVGIAFGIDHNVQSLGDVLVATQVIPYEHGKLKPDTFIPRGTPVGSDAHLIQAARIIRRQIDGFDMHYGPVLSGDKLVNRGAFKEYLIKHHPRAIGGEMEGAGISSATSRRRRGFLLVKGICDWGEDKTDSHQEIAAENAIKTVVTMLGSDLIVAGG